VGEVVCDDRSEDIVLLRVRRAEWNDPIVLLLFRCADSAAATTISAEDLDTGSALVVLSEFNRGGWSLFAGSYRDHGGGESLKNISFSIGELDPAFIAG